MTQEELALEIIRIAIGMASNTFGYESYRKDIDNLYADVFMSGYVTAMELKLGTKIDLDKLKIIQNYKIRN